MTSVRTVVVRCVGSSLTTFVGFGDGSDVGSPTLQNDVVQRQAVTPVDKNIVMVIKRASAVELKS